MRRRSNVMRRESGDLLNVKDDAPVQSDIVCSSAEGDPMRTVDVKGSAFFHSFMRKFASTHSP